MADQRSVKEIFGEAVELPADRRAAFLDGACGGDAVVRARVEALLAVHGRAGAFLGAPTNEPPVGVSGAADDATIAVTAGTGPERPLGEAPGSVIGRYKLLEVIGEGGFGVVFMAEQREPVVRRVALKIIKLGMDTRQVIARFEAERQALALMDHPSIARVLDAGATNTGRPYFVMELVKGEPITTYADRNRLRASERLELFVQVCQAVQHAHTKGVIHRDLKPSNVLVTEIDGRPVPKVIDFGVAKATAARLTEKTVFTEFRQFIGTPEYMSPEQAALSGVDIDTRSDVYSLGVLLYELLTGVTPLDPARLRSAAWDEMLRIIREEEPPRPSTRLSTMKETIATVAAHRHIEPSRLPRLLQGDLDWIVMKCLEKDRARRYEMASALGADVQRHLDHEPVLAGPPSQAYWLRKFVRRNRVAVVAGLLIGAAMIFGLAGTTAGLLWALRERSRAEQEAGKTRLAEADQIRERVRAEGQSLLARQEADRADAVLELVQGMLGSADPHATKGPGYTLKSLLIDYDRTLESDRPRQPLVEASLLATMGWAYRGIGDAARAQAHLERALSIRREQLAPDHPDIAETLWRLGLVLHDRHDFTGAERIQNEAIRMLRKTEPEGAAIATALTARADVLRHLARYDEAEADGREGLAIRRRLYGGEDASIAVSLNNLGLVLKSRGDSKGAESLLLEALAMTRRLEGDASPTMAIRLTNLASLLRERGDEAGAVPLLRQALAIDRAALGEDHAEVATDKTNLAILLRRTGNKAEAEPLLREALAVRRTLLGDEDLDTANTMNSLGLLLRETGRYAEAEPLLRDSLALRRRLLGEEHADVLASKINLASLLKDRRDFDGAEALFRETLATCRKNLPVDHIDVAQSLVNLGMLLRDRGDDAGSESFFREALPIFEKRRPAGHASVARVRLFLGHALLRIASNASLPEAERIERVREAEPLLVAAQASMALLPLSERRDLRETLADLASLYELRHALEPDQGFDAKAAEWRDRLGALDAANEPERTR